MHWHRRCVAAIVAPRGGCGYFLAIAFALLWSTQANVAIANPPAASEELSRTIDDCIDAQLDAHRIAPAPQVNDRQYLRRVTLDLAGRVPSLQELTEFDACNDSSKREQLVDRLLGSADFAYHMRNEVDMLWLGRLQWNADWRGYLLKAMEERRTLSEVVSELLVPERFRPGDKGAAAFLKSRINDLDVVTNDTSSLLFGVNVACAKCHDHPLVPDWHQDHYYGLAAFFKRTFATKRGSLAERFEGEIKFTTTKGVEKKSQFMFLDGKVVEERKVARSDDEWKSIRDRLKKSEQDDKADAPPEPDWSPRQSLLSLALENGEQSMLARNLANRIWAQFMGRGLVHPLDQMHSGNAPSHPELLTALARELVSNAYDPRSLIRGIVLSRAYSRASNYHGSASQPSPELFAVQQPRPLSPFQFSLSLWLASRHPDKLPGLEKDDHWPKQRKEWEQRSESLARRFEIPSEYFQISVEEALMLSNSSQSQRDFLSSDNGTLLGKLDQTQDAIERIRLAYMSILSREASEEERAAILEYLGAHEDRPQVANQHIVWALLTSAEFRFNH